MLSSRHAALSLVLLSILLAACRIAGASEPPPTPTVVIEPMAVRDAGPMPLFPGVRVYEATGAATSPGLPVLIPYSDALLQAWVVGDEQSLVAWERDAAGLWARVPAVINASANDATVHPGGSAWTVTPPGTLTPWQSRALVGAIPRAGARNLVIIHGWNASPFDGCTLSLTAAVMPYYDRVLAYAYPSALDIEENAAWLRDRLLQFDPGARLDIAGASLGGLIARAAIEGEGPAQLAASRVDRMITIGTPHRGMRHDAPPSFLGDTASQQTSAGSAFLASLNARRRPPGVQYYAIGGGSEHGGTSDGLIDVASALGSGVLAPARSVVVPLGHAPTLTGGMPCAAEVYDTLAAWLGP